MVKNNLWFVLAIIAFITLILLIYMSYKTAITAYAWIGPMLLGMGCGSKYNKEKKVKMG